MGSEPKNRRINDSQGIEYLNYLGCLAKSHACASQGSHRRHSGGILGKDTTFFDEFAAEIDIFDQEKVFPDWIYRYREKVLAQIPREYRLICRALKENGTTFKIKYPLEIAGEWKFADFYLPDRNTVVLYIRDFERIGLPCFSKTDRELWFGRAYHVIPVEKHQIGNLDGSVTECGFRNWQAI